MARLIPGGRGTKLDPFAQRESVQERAAKAQRVLPQYTLGYFQGTLGASATGVFATTGFTLGPLERINVQMAVSQVRCVVAAASAGSVIDVGIYVYTGGEFVLLPGSLATLDTSAVGTASTDLPTPIVLDPQQRLFLGCKPRVADASLQVIAGGTHAVSLSYLALPAANSVPGRVSRDSVTKSSSIGLAAIQYLSTEAALLL